MAAAPKVGAHVYLAGTGQHYQGEHYGAVVVDIRESDNTVKVRFTDGGYKRYKIPEYQGLIQEVKYVAQMPEEWDAVQRTPSQDGVSNQPSELKLLHEQIMSAVAGGDFLKANELQGKYKSMVTNYDKIHALEIKLIDTVNQGEFMKAHEIQNEIKSLKGAGAAAPVTTPATLKEKPSLGDILRQAGGSAARGGLAGACAMALQVVSLMWMRTTMNYQYRYGTTTREALKHLYAEGGIPRFYRGIGPGLIQGPISRFGDTAANAGVLALFEHSETAKHWPSAFKTVFSSASAASMRIVLVPVDTVKTMMQVEGKEGLPKLQAKLKAHGPSVMFHGALATCAATFVGHYPWFTVFNTLQASIPQQDGRGKKLLRNAGIGFCASASSDTISNSLRVVKTIRQTNDTMSYSAIVKSVVEKDGVMGLMGRGLKTRLIANGTQGIMFSVLYKLFEEKFMKK